MQRPIALSSNIRTNNCRQAYVLLLLGVIFFALAWSGLFHAYPIGELFFGLGMLAAAPFNTHRLLAAAWLTTLIGSAGFLVFGQTLPSNQLLSAHVLAIGLGFLGIWWLSRRGYISTDTLLPGVFIIGVGVVEYLQAAHLTPTHFLAFALSLWLPGYGLFILGLLCLATSSRTIIQHLR